MYKGISSVDKQHHPADRRFANEVHREQRLDIAKHVYDGELTAAEAAAYIAFFNTARTAWAQISPVLKKRVPGSALFLTRETIQKTLHSKGR